MQYNTMQCNTMQYNAMYVRKSVRPYGMKSVSHFFYFLFFFECVRKSVSMYGTRMSRMDEQFQLFFLVSMYRLGWTDKFQLFRTCRFSRIQSSKVCPSVRRSQPKKKKKKYVTNKDRNTINRVIHSMAKLNVTIGTISGNLSVRTDGLRPSMQNQMLQTSTNKHRNLAGGYALKWKFQWIYLSELWQN
jgi:hypothetical protein